MSERVAGAEAHGADAPHVVAGVNEDAPALPLSAEEGAAFFHIIGSLLYNEPTKDVIAGLAESGLFDEMPFEEDGELFIKGQEAMSAWLASAPASELASEAKGEYMRLLVGVGDTLASPWASVYLDRDGLLFGDETLEARVEFSRFGQELREKYHEPDDHIGIELEFVGFLLEQDHAAEAQRFARERVAIWVSTWNADVQAHGRCEYYRALGNLAEAGVRLLVGRLGT